MATARPVVSVYKFDNPGERTGTIVMPHVLMSPLRPDMVQFLHHQIYRNKRMPFGVGSKVGYETAAESWGTGRAVARIPRAPGGGTHRAGQGTFGNMCRGGGMFCPTKTWRRWHRRVPVTQKRHAIASALAASSLPALVMARGHRIEKMEELPAVISDGIESITKTKQAVEVLDKLGLKEERERIIKSRKIRRGKGKMRNRRYTMRRGPIFVYLEDKGICQAVRNLPGVTSAHVMRLNLLRIAPGGHFGRLLIFSESAFKKLNEIYGSLKSGAPMKNGYTLPRAQMVNADIGRIINSTEIQSVLRPKLEAPVKHEPKRNALRQKSVMRKLNPYVKPVETTEEIQKRKRARIEASTEYNKKYKKGDNTFYKVLMRAFQPKKAPETEEGGEEE